jgi:5-methyltetrahydrofolate--homocysteine methyltransferase
MELEFRKDFDDVRKNWRLFWEGKLNRPIIIAIVPKPGKEVVSPPKWGAAFSQPPEKVVDQALQWAESVEFCCDAVPFFTPSLMTGFIPALLGAKIIEVHEPWGVDTAVVPFVEDLNNINLTFHRDSIWWERWLNLCECIKKKCKGKMIFGEATIAGNLDLLGAIRGTDRLMLDFYDNPEGVHNAMQQILKIYNEILDEYVKIFEFEKYGGVTRHGFYADGLIGVPQCDFGFNISKKHFDEFALPYLKEEIRRLDAVEYHLDGPGNIKHLESICSIDKIGVIQWVAGAGNENKDWTELYEKIDNLGKGLWLWADSPEMAVVLWKKYKNSGKLILSVPAKNKDEAMRYMDVFQ